MQHPGKSCFISTMIRLPRHSACVTCTAPPCPSFSVLVEIGVTPSDISTNSKLPTELLYLATCQGLVDWEKVYLLKGEKVHAIFECFEPHLRRDGCVRQDVRELFNRVLVKLVRRSGQLPRFLYITDVKKLHEYCNGGGSYGDVFESTWNGMKVALKVIRFTGLDKDVRFALLSDFHREAVYWQQFWHPHILELYGVYDKSEGDRVGLVSPWMQNGNLAQYLRENPDANLYDLMYQASTAIQYLHGRNPPLVHGDIKPTNMLIDEHGNLQLCDFGFTSIAELETISKSRSGLSFGNTLSYCAPEMMISETQRALPANNTKTDVYSFGISLCETFTSTEPWKGVRPYQVLTDVQKGKRPSYSKEVPEHVRALFEACWAQNPEERLNISVVVDKCRSMMFNSHVVGSPYTMVNSKCLVALNIMDQVGEEYGEHSIRAKAALDITYLPNDVCCMEIFEFLCKHDNLAGGSEDSAKITGMVAIILRRPSHASVAFSAFGDALRVQNCISGSKLRPKESGSHRDLVYVIRDIEDDEYDFTKSLQDSSSTNPHESSSTNSNHEPTNTFHNGTLPLAPRNLNEHVPTSYGASDLTQIQDSHGERGTMGSRRNRRAGSICSSISIFKRKEGQKGQCVVM